ncbi:MAG: hypothetical protein N2515_06555 [Deltaproteobacteria bacterium]|nr:hypothetical protein [Deltaproteobacteria bacterium]
MSKFKEVLEALKIDPRRIVSASKRIERRRPEDHRLVILKRKMKAGEIEKDPEILKQKPRSGRPVTLSLLGKAIRGEKISGPSKTRIVRAINAILEKRKQPPLTWRDLF